MFKLITTIAACTLIGLSLPEIDGGYLYLASFALGAFILGGILSNEL